MFNKYHLPLNTSWYFLSPAFQIVRHATHIYETILNELKTRPDMDEKLIYCHVILLNLSQLEIINITLRANLVVMERPIESRKDEAKMLRWNYNLTEYSKNTDMEPRSLLIM